MGTAQGPVCAVPIPYDFPLTPYRRAPLTKPDRMWYWDELQSEPDDFGRIVGQEAAADPRASRRRTDSSANDDSDG